MVLVLLQNKYLYTCKNIAKKSNVDEFLRKHFEQYYIENCGKQNEICVVTDRLLSSYTCSFTVFFYLVIYVILCLLLIYFLLCAVHGCCYFAVNKNKFVVTWTRQYFTRRTNLTLTIVLRWPWKVGVFLAILTFFYCNPINNKWKISRTKEKYKTTTISVLGWCTKRNFYIL